MRIRHNLPLMQKLAVENIEEVAVAPGEEVVAEPIEAGADSVEAELIEINEDAADVQADEETVEEAVDIAEELEVAAEALRIIASQGGLDRNGAQMANLHLESLNRRIGLPAKHKMLAAESFGATHTRIDLTNRAVESFSEKANDLWKHIVEMFEKAIAGIVGLWNRIFDGATKLKVRAEKVAAAAKNVKGEASNKSFENQKLAEALHEGGTVDIKSATKALNDTAMLLSAMTDSGLKAAETMYHAIQSGDTSKLSSAAADARKQFPNKVANAADVGLGEPGEGLELFKAGDELPGNRALILIAPAADDASPALVGKIAYKMGVADTSKKVSEKASMPVLSPADAEAIAKQLVNVADGVLKFKPAQKKVEAEAKKVQSLAKSKANQNKEDAEGKLSGSDAVQLAKGALAMTIHAAPPLATYLVNTAAAAVQYAEQSLKQYGAAKKEEAPAAEPAAA